MRAVILASLALAACATDVADTDAIYARAGGAPRVLCGVGVDTDDIAIDELEAGMRRAVDRGEVLMLFAHKVGKGGISPARLDAILAAADRAGLPTVTFPELTDPARAGAPGLSLGFDDHYVDRWFAMRDVFRRHGAHVTFFVSNYDRIDATGVKQLHELADDGHAIEAHGMGHRDAPDYVDDHGVADYLAVEIDPLLAAMSRDGFHPTTFAYPFGDRTRELDDALLTRFRLLRSVTYLDRSVLNSAPCPR